MYTAAESNALVKIVPVGVVVPFDAVQKCCSEDRPLDVVPPGTGTKVANAGNRNGSRQCREQERKRVVLPPPTLPKNVIAVLTRAGEHSGRRRSGGLLFHLVCAQETEWGELSKQRK